MCPSVYIGSNGVIPPVSPKSYLNSPLVSFGQEAGSLAIHLIFFPSSKLRRKKGKDSPAKFEPPPNGAITISGRFPAFSICLIASCPTIV